MLPTDFLAFRFEFISRHSNVPYFAGRGGTTSPDGWQGTLGPFVPDVAKHENRLTFAINWRMRGPGFPRPEELDLWSAAKD